MQIQDKVFLVSGGASGLGAATAQMLVAAGAKVMLVDMNAEAVAAQAEKLGAQARWSVADVSQEAPAQAAVDAAVEAFGGLHGLVNCAGVVGAEKNPWQKWPARAGQLQPGDRRQLDRQLQPAALGGGGHR
jgi:NAD(P)-dependent dehydrogenase (short-subunit alcohol dehydrogenase family)